MKGGNVFFSPDPSEAALTGVAAEIGDGALLYSSDFPHEVNVERCRHELEELAERSDLSPSLKAGLLADNARRFYGLRGEAP